MLSEEEIEQRARSVGNLKGTVGMTCPNDILNPVLYLGAKIALQNLFLDSMKSIDEVIEFRKKQFTKPKDKE